MPKSFCLLIRLFNYIIFPVNRQLPEKIERDSKDVPTSHFLAQYFSPNSSLGEFTGGSKVEYAMWRRRWEGAPRAGYQRKKPGGGISRTATAQFTLLRMLLSQSLRHPSTTGKKGAPGHKRSCSAAVTSLLLDPRVITSGRRMKCQGHLEVMFFVRCTTVAVRCKTPGQRGVLSQSRLRATLPAQEVLRHHETWGFLLTCCHHHCCGQQTVCQSSALLSKSC